MTNDVAQILSRCFIGISKIICSAGIDQKEFIKYLRFYLAHTSREKHPEKSIAELSHITGLSRGVLSKHLNTNKPPVVHDKLSILLSELWKIKDGNSQVFIKGKKSFYSIATTILNSSYSPETALNTLIKLEAVEFNADKIKIMSERLIVSNDFQLFYNIVGKTIDRLVDTVLWNRSNTDKKYQNTIRSTQISAKHKILLHKELKQLIQETVIPEIQRLVDSHECDVPTGTYSECGLSLFEF